ncbi:MAG: S-layer homology domain-containing protein, partial [Candidatus Peregrinibacteria bacterium]|nr:S-layer homology domain-containing protein [Candidatus Peregrinibacteria bacterium]
SPTRGTPGTTFYFDASEVSDSQYKSTSLEVRWDWDGDGDYDTEFETDKTTSHQYDDADTYEIIMQVKDPEGQTSTYSQTIEVISSTSPVASLEVDLREGTFSTLFHFDGSGSYDGETDFDDLWFRWDWDYTGSNDIIYDTSWSRSETKTQKFDQSGDITVRLEVKDEDDEITTAYVTLSIHWASEYLENLKRNGVMRGYSGGDMRPDQNVTRSELLKMSMEAAEIYEGNRQYQGYFWDVSSSDWFDNYVEVAYEMSIVNGYGNYFEPEAEITRAEAVKIIVETFDLELKSYQSGTFPDVDGSQWYADYIAIAYEYNLISGHSDGYFHPDWKMTRGEAAKIISLAMEANL